MLYKKLAELGVFINGLRLLAHKVLWAVGIDPSHHSTGSPHQILLGVVTRDNDLDISGDLP